MKYSFFILSICCVLLSACKKDEKDRAKQRKALLTAHEWKYVTANLDTYLKFEADGDGFDYEDMSIVYKPFIWSLSSGTVSGKMADRITFKYLYDNGIYGYETSTFTFDIQELTADKLVLTNYKNYNSKITLVYIKKQ